MSWVPPRAWVDGNPVPAAHLNEVSAQLNLLKTSITDDGHIVAPVIHGKIAPYTALPTDDIIVCDGTFTVTLYSTSSGTFGRILQIKNVGTGVITIDANGADTIDGALTIVLDQQYASVTLLCALAGIWYIL
jgi:hypothetical protein